VQFAIGLLDSELINLSATNTAIAVDIARGPAIGTQSANAGVKLTPLVGVKLTPV